MPSLLASTTISDFKTSFQHHRQAHLSLWNKQDSIRQDKRHFFFKRTESRFRKPIFLSLSKSSSTESLFEHRNKRTTELSIMISEYFFEQATDSDNNRPLLLPDKRNAYTTRCTCRHQTSRPSGPASPSSPVLTLSVPCPPVKRLQHFARQSLPT